MSDDDDDDELLFKLLLDPPFSSLFWKNLCDADTDAFSDETALFTTEEVVVVLAELALLRTVPAELPERERLLLPMEPTVPPPVPAPAPPPKIRRCCRKAVLRLLL